MAQMQKGLKWEGIILDEIPPYGIGVGKNAPFRGILEDYPAPMGYSLRQLNPSATLCLRVRRSQQVGVDDENDEMDIGFVNGWLDTTTLWNFVALTAYAGQGIGSVVKWYDQSGNGRDLQCPVAGSQPIIVSAGNILTLNSKPAMYFGNGQYLQSGGGWAYPTGSQFACVFGVFKADDNGSHTYTKLFEIRNENSPINRARLVMRLENPVSRKPRMWASPYGQLGGTGIVSMVNTLPTSYNDWFKTALCQSTMEGNISASIGSMFRKDGFNAQSSVANGNLAYDAELIDCMTIGGNAATYSPSADSFNGYINEMLFYNDIRSDIGNIEANQKAAWGTP